MPRTRQLPDLFRPRYPRLALPARRPEKWPIQAPLSWIHSPGEIVAAEVSVTAEINAYGERINCGMEKRSSRGPSSICAERQSIRNVCPDRISVSTVSVSWLQATKTALRHGHRRLGQTESTPGASDGTPRGPRC